MISGVGLASAKIIGSFAIFLTISGVNRAGFETPMNMSAPVIASLSERDIT
jgi:hypothetical protein